MYKFKALTQFSHDFENGSVMYDVRRESYQLDDKIVKEWEKAGYVKIVEERKKVKMEKAE